MKQRLAAASGRQALAGKDGISWFSLGKMRGSACRSIGETIPEVVASIVRNGSAILQAKSREYSLEEICFEIR